MTNKYIALTTGPILKTLQNARSTKELWAASYLFSYLMRLLMQQIRNEGREIILPYSDDKKGEKFIFNQHLGAGIFPDRLIFKAKEGEDDFVNMQTWIKKALHIIEKEISCLAFDLLKEDTKHFKFEGNTIQRFLEDYFQIYFIEKEIEDITDGKLITELTPHLEALELQQKFIQREQVNRFKDAKKVYQNILETFTSFIHRTELYKQVFPLENYGRYNYLNEVYKQRKKWFHKGIIGFPSTRDIATFELTKQANDKTHLYQAIAKVLDQEENAKQESGEDALYLALENGAKDGWLSPLQDYHKYYCIVLADGDNIGKTIKGLTSAENYQVFSKKLADFAKDAVQDIDAFGGKPIYIGGDDLLFFAPVRVGEETIFDLLATLDKTFQKQQFGGSPTPTLSYGVSISYHKHPLFEALESSQELLFQYAKKFQLANRKKNAIAFRVLRHSGAYWEATLNKEVASFELFNELLQFSLGDEGFFNSMTYKLREGKEILQSLYQEEQTVEENKRFGYYFKNYFNEPIHAKEGEKYLETLGKLFPQVFQDYGKDKAPDVLFAMLRTLNFITPKNTTAHEPVEV